MKEKILISVGEDTTDEELKVFKSAIENIKGIKFELDKNIKLCSGIELPYIIEFCISSVAGGILWDQIKFVIKKIFSSKNIKRHGSIIIRYRTKQLIFSKNRTVIRENTIDIEFENIDSLIEFIKSNLKKPLAKVYHFSSFGKRQEKYDNLNETEFNDVNWKELEIKETYYFFVPKDFGAEEKYNQGFSISEIFNINSSGVTTSRDNFIIDEDKDILKDRIQDFINLSKDDLYIKYGLKDTRDFKIENVKKEILKIDDFKFTKIDYRIFDTKNIYYEVKLIDWNRQKVMSHMLGENLGVILMRQFVEDNGFNHVFASKNMVDNRTFSSSRGTAYFFPLYLYNNQEKNLLNEENPEKTPNLNGDIIVKIEEKLGLKLNFSLSQREYPKGEGLENDTFTPENLFDYIYAVLHSQTYRETYKEFLKIDFPKVPFNTDKETFFKMAKLGKELRIYHLLENENLIPKNFITKYEVDGDNMVEKVKYIDECVFINDTQYFSGVPENVWNFYIGGYQPAQKWLKDRKGRNLNYEDILHYGKIILILNETTIIMQEIEKVFKV